MQVINILLHTQQTKKAITQKCNSFNLQLTIYYFNESITFFAHFLQIPWEISLLSNGSFSPWLFLHHAHITFITLPPINYQRIPILTHNNVQLSSMQSMLQWFLLKYAYYHLLIKLCLCAILNAILNAVLCSAGNCVLFASAINLFIFNFYLFNFISPLERSVWSPHSLYLVI